MYIRVGVVALLLLVMSLVEVLGGDLWLLVVTMFVLTLPRCITFRLTYQRHQYGSIAPSPETYKVLPLDFWTNVSWTMEKANVKGSQMLLRIWTSFSGLVLVSSSKFVGGTIRLK